MSATDEHDWVVLRDWTTPGSPWCRRCGARQTSNATTRFGGPYLSSFPPPPPCRPTPEPPRPPLGFGH